ncbi:unnamed protein product [Microthlaspi erraticum]|uniref:phosphoethanolamine N-methyltransferase n=1 Tax=Microthlaspi erraticum TaxID=1685480 RepID=A0A6D2LBG5_9BRAS|nr:unnamed protein product [Microthlaspi erraticum]
MVSMFGQFVHCCKQLDQENFSFLLRVEMSSLGLKVEMISDPGVVGAIILSLCQVPEGLGKSVYSRLYECHNANTHLLRSTMIAESILFKNEKRYSLYSLHMKVNRCWSLEPVRRFTCELAQKAGEPIALDFIDSVIKKNESVNGHYKNVKFMCADVTSPDLKSTDGSIDLILSNWLLMYLSDKEVELLVERMVGWIKVGGYIFFRESCFHQSGDSKRKSNPTHYHEPCFYTKVFQECQTRDAAGNSFELSMIGCKCIGAYVKSKKNQYQPSQNSVYQ